VFGGRLAYPITLNGIKHDAIPFSHQYIDNCTFCNFFHTRGKHSCTHETNMWAFHKWIAHHWMFYVIWRHGQVLYFGNLVAPLSLKFLDNEKLQRYKGIIYENKKIALGFNNHTFSGHGLEIYMVELQPLH
jgi:hypothetical protein